MSALRAPQPFRCDVVDEPGRVRVAPVGELDLFTVEPLVQTIRELRRSGVEHLILDLRGVSFIDSPGVRLAFDLHTEAAGTACDSNWCLDLRTSSGSSS
jgi:anti-anti-sigma factor